MGKSLRADVIEPLVWAHVCEMLTDSERLQAGLERLIEEERAQAHGDPDREARAWADRIVAVERKRSGFQDMAAEGLITFDELRAKLAELEEDREMAQSELETLARRQQRIERLEEDAEEVMRSYAGMLPENLRTLDANERHEVYRMLRLRVAAYPDGTLLASGALGKADHVYTTETTSRHCSPDTGAGPSRSFGAFGRARHTSQAAETLWALSGAAQRAPLRTGQALSAVKKAA